jgi:hypothetical protein
MATKPSLLIITAALPTRCPACGSEAITSEDRGGWWRVACATRPEICTWSAKYEVKP